MPQFDYAFPDGVLGQLATFDYDSIDSFVNPLLAQQSTATVDAAAADGDYTIRISGPEGVFDVSFAASSNTAAEIAAGLAAAGSANDLFANVATFSSALAVLTLDFLHPGFSYTVVATSQPSPLTVATPQAAGGTTVPVGLVVVATSAKEARLPQTGDTAPDFWGITVRNTELVQSIQDTFNDLDAFFPADAFSVIKRGSVKVEPETAYATGDQVYVRVSGTGQPGALSNAAGAGLVLWPGARFRTSGAAGTLATVQLNQPS